MEDATMTTQTASQEQMKEAKKHFTKIGLILFIGIGFTYAVCSGVESLCFYLWPDVLKNNITLTSLVGFIPQYVVCMPLMAFLLSRLPGATLAKRNVGFGWGVVFFLISFATMYLMNVVGLLVNSIFSIIFKGEVFTSYAVADILMGADSWLIILFAVILAPLFEEFIFRKLLIDRCFKYGELISALVSGLVFGLFHGNITQGIYAFGLGFIFAIIYSKTGKIYVTMILHCIINFMGSIVASWVLGQVDLETFSNLDPTDTQAYMATLQENAGGLVIMGVYFLFLFAAVIAGIVLLIINRQKFFAMQPGEIVIPKGKRFSTVIVNYGMGLLIIGCLALFVYNFIYG